MSIVPMKKLQLIAMRDSRDELLRQLMLLRCVEITELDADAAADLSPETAHPGELRQSAAELDKAIQILQRYAPVKSGLFTLKPEVAPYRLLDEALLEENLRTAGRINALEEKIRETSARVNELRARCDALKPWQLLDFPLQTRRSKTCVFLCGTVPAERDVQALADAIESVAPEAQLISVSRDAWQHYLFLICHHSALQPMLDTLSQNSFAEADFGDLQGTASENLNRLEDLIHKEQAELEALQRDMLAKANLREELYLGADRLALKIERAEAAEKLCAMGSVILLQAWCPEDSLPSVETLLKEKDCAWLFSAPTAEEIPAVPVKLKNNKFSRALNMVTNMYSLPAYNGIDPNPLMAPFFIFFYGMMMADMGYGLLMILAAVFVLRKMRPRETLRDFGDLLLYCGISTFVFGAVTGGFFGDFIPQIAMLLNPDTTLTELPHLFTPLEDTMSILIGAVCLGVVQTFTGMAVSVVHKFKNKEALSAVFEEVAWWLILIGLALCILKIGNINGLPVVLLLGCADLIIGQFVMKKSVVGGLTGIIGAVYNGATGFFSDFLSYSRLMALMLSGSIIATVFNTLGTIPGSVPVFILISMIGNALNFALNILGCYVHDLRLQCLEFFGRFYMDGGRPFKPLNILNTKYVDIIKEEN